MLLSVSQGGVCRPNASAQQLHRTPGTTMGACAGDHLAKHCACDVGRGAPLLWFCRPAALHEGRQGRGGPGRQRGTEVGRLGHAGNDLQACRV